MAYLGWKGPRTVRRRLIQLACTAVFVLLPVLDLLRFDFPNGKLFVFRRQIWLDEWTLVWLALMFAMWIVGALTLTLGRVYCSFACPQMIFTELAHDIEELARRVSRRVPEGRRAIVERTMSLGIIALLSVAASALLMGYFAELPEVMRRLLRLDATLWVGAIGLATTVFAFLDLVLVREEFCRSICPYGLLQGVLTDEKSLHVRFDAASGECTECGLCAKVCNMGIDIRDGSFQMECTRCGNCIDACDRVFARKQRPGLLAYAIGSPGASKWDLKRTLVAISTLGFGAVFVVAVALREPIAFHLSPVYAGAAQASAGVAEARYLLRAANKSTGPVRLEVAIEGLPAGSVVDGMSDGRVPAGEERDFDLRVRVPRATLKETVTPFTCVVKTGQTAKRFAMTFYAGRPT